MLPMKTYSEKLKDPRWQRKRLEIMKRDGFSCVECQESNTTLAVHHRYYISGRMPWEYPDWSLKTLCKDCHKLDHDMDVAREEDSNLPHEDQFETIMEFLCGGGSNSDESLVWCIAAQISMMRLKLGASEGLNQVLKALKSLRKKIDQEEGAE